MSGDNKTRPFTSTGAAPPDDWFYVSGEKELGPFSEVHLRALLAGGEIVPDTMVRKRSWMDWQSIGSIDLSTTSPKLADSAFAKEQTAGKIDPVVLPGAQHKLRQRAVLVSLIVAAVLVAAVAVGLRTFGNAQSTPLPGPVAAVRPADSDHKLDVGFWDEVYEPARAAQQTPNQGDGLAENDDVARGHRPPYSPDAIYAKVSPAVVCVVVRNSAFKPVALGSGFVISADGLIVTNYHVIEDAYYANIRFADGTTYLVEGVGASDKEADLALLKIKGDALAAVELGEARLPPIGTKVLAIGNPQGLTNTLSDGLVSGHRSLSDSLTEIQITASISPGSSGGPLLNEAGQVIGVTASTLTEGQNLNFAIPVERVTHLLERRGELKSLASCGGGRLESGQAVTLESVWTKIDAKDYAGALRSLEELRGTQEDKFYYWATLGYIHLSLENGDLAADAYKHALELSPSRAEIHYNLGNAYCQSGRDELAVAAYRTCSALDPHDAGAFYALGLTLARLKRYTEAIEELRSAVALHPTSSKYLSTLSGVYELSDRMKEATETRELSIKNGAKDAESYYWLGVDYKCLQRNEDAITALQYAIGIDPQHAEARSVLGEVYWRLKRYREAIPELESAIGIKEDLARAQCFLGVCYWETDRAGPGLTHMRRAAQLDPDGQYGKLAATYVDAITSLLQQHSMEEVQKMTKHR